MLSASRLLPLLPLFVVLKLTYGYEECNQPIAIYKELQCTPIYGNTSTNGCPVRFDCSKIHKRPLDKCTYRGKVYNLGEPIPENKVVGNCHTDCVCSDTDQIECAILDCPEVFNELQPDNHLTYTLNQCCATGQMSAPYATCKVNGNVYKEGERFSGPHPCTRCVCARGWKGDFVEPFCTEQYCSDEILYLEQIKANGAPVGDGCCPESWIYPGLNDTITSNNGYDKPEVEVCVFGTNYLKIGDQLVRIESENDFMQTITKCECIIPPFLTCMSQDKYIRDSTPQIIKDSLDESDYL